MKQEYGKLMKIFIEQLDKVLLEKYSDMISPATALNEEFPHIFNIMYKEFCEHVDSGLSNLESNYDND